MWVLAPFVGYAQSTQASAGVGSGPTKGICVYYNDKFQGRPVASGEKYDAAKEIDMIKEGKVKVQIEGVESAKK